MSKSKGNLVMVSDLLKKYSPNAIRWLLLSHHWHKNWEFKEKDLIQAQKDVEAVEKTLASPDQVWEAQTKQFTKIMDQNLDTPKALEYLFKLAKQGKKIPKNLFNTLGFK